MPKINDIFDDSERFINGIADANDKRIAKTIKSIEKQVVNLLQDMQPTAGASDRFKLKRAQEVQGQLINILEVEYDGLANALKSDLSSVNKTVIAELDLLGIDAAFTTVDKELFGTLQDSVITQFKNYSKTAQEQLSQGLYDYVGGASDFSGVVDNFKNVLLGVAGMGGTPLVSYAQGFAHDSVMEYFSAIQHKKANDAGLTDYIYYGNIIKSSRPFCIARVGRIFTKQQIEAWNSFVWKGKKRGSIWINRGGYNCRHHFRAVKKEWVSDGLLDVGSFFDENPKAYAPDLREQVKKEIAKL